VVPEHGLLRISISPQCISMVLRTMVRPSPTPKLLGWKGFRKSSQILPVDADAIAETLTLPSPLKGFHFNDARVHGPGPPADGSKALLRT